MKKKRYAAIIHAAMRITYLQIILILVFSASLSAKEAHSQAALEKIINISVNKEEVKKVLLSITRQTGVKFLYSSDLVDVKKKISCELETKKLREFLEEVLAPFGISYKVVSDQQILLVRTDPSSGQEVAGIHVSGKVLNDKGEPMSGASIQLKGSVTGTTTDAGGKFQLEVPDRSSVLLISSVGYRVQEILIGEKTYFEVKLTALSNALDEAIVIGYGSTQKKNLTYSISKVGEKELKDIPITSFQQGLQGKVAGLKVTEPSGKPGGIPFLRLRVISSVNLASDPLYVLDGVVT
ncbi:MAG: carboxypeptidase-like regulatory domain-containing protein, partial [Chitinophaga rupis]